jgi:hypothetical protein
MSLALTIGNWHERAARDINHCPSYYAADSETLRTTPGAYPVRLVFQTGYNIPMPYWLCVAIPCTRVSGRLYSGFGGVNYSSTELKAGEAVDYHVQAYHYSLNDYIKQEIMTVRPSLNWLTQYDPMWKAPQHPQTWEALRALIAYHDTLARDGERAA